MGVSIISACASNEANMDANESDAEATKEEVVAATQESKAEVQAVKEEATQEATQAATETSDTAAEASDTMSEATNTQTDTVSSSSNNPKSTCEHSGQVRIITVVNDNDATDTVCEVTYEKSTGVQTLWTANSDRDYCMEKATAFVQKQEGWGWTCSAIE